jgi:hypothetical protein
VRRADHSSREVLPIVVRSCVGSRNLVNEEAIAHWGLSRQKQTNKPVNFRKYLYALRCVQVIFSYTVAWYVMYIRR